MKLDRPKQTARGWYVAEFVPEGDGYFCNYLHPDGEMYPSMNGVNGEELVGYFKTELDAYKAIYNFFFNML